MYYIDDISSALKEADRLRLQNSSSSTAQISNVQCAPAHQSQIRKSALRKSIVSLQKLSSALPFTTDENALSSPPRHNEIPTSRTEDYFEASGTDATEGSTLDPPNQHNTEIPTSSASEPKKI